MEHLIKRKSTRKLSAKQRLQGLIDKRGAPEEVFYCRVSNKDLHLDNQKNQFFAKYPDKKDIRIVEDTVEGDGDRKNLFALFNTLPPGSTIYTISIDRLSRSVKDLFTMVEVCVENGIEMESIREKESIVRMDVVLLALLGGLAQKEKKNISERTSEGIKTARKKSLSDPRSKGRWGYGLAKLRGTVGKKPGKKTNKIFLEALPDIKELREKGYPIRRIAQLVSRLYKFEFSEPNISRLLKYGHG